MSVDQSLLTKARNLDEIDTLPVQLWFSSDGDKDRFVLKIEGLGATLSDFPRRALVLKSSMLLELFGIRDDLRSTLASYSAEEYISLLERKATPFELYERNSAALLAELPVAFIKYFDQSGVLQKSFIRLLKEDTEVHVE